MNLKLIVSLIAMSILSACSQSPAGLPPNLSEEINRNLLNSGNKNLNGGLLFRNFPVSGLDVKIVRVSASGTISSLTPKSSLVGGLISPNNKMVQFKKDHNVWVLDLDTMDERQISTLGLPSDAKFDSVEAEAVGWSWDSGKIIYSIRPGYSEEEEGPELKERVLDYGFYICNLRENSNVKVELPGKFIGWLPNGDFLLLTETNLSKNTQILRYRLGEPSPQPVVPLKGEFNQIEISRDGEWILTNCSSSLGSPTQVMLISLKTGEIRTLTKKVGWAENQWPRLSPTGKHFSFVKQIGPLNSYEYSLYVDNTEVYHQKKDISFYVWISDRLIALFNDDDKPTIVDVEKSEPI